MDLALMNCPLRGSVALGWRQTRCPRVIRRFETMIIRSGLIENLPHVAKDAFETHWREVHGPLAVKLPKLKGYVQNHIVERRDGPRGALHRVDGISQLWFDDVDAMVTGMSSPENDACVVDISGFLARVTLAVQEPGTWVGDHLRWRDGAKLMAVFTGHNDAAELEKSFAAALPTIDSGPVAYRFNRVVKGEFIVDATVARSDEPVSAILEAHFESDEDRRRFIDSDLVTRSAGAPAATVLAVRPFVFLVPGA
jgi:uncharacterized protein (TIGR02118 family)